MKDLKVFKRGFRNDERIRASCESTGGISKNSKKIVEQLIAKQDERKE